MTDSTTFKHCEICNAPPTFYQRVRPKDHATRVCDHPVFETIKVTGGIDTLVDIIIHTCGGIIIRKGRKLFAQPPEAHGFKDYDMQAWEEHEQCPEATRILKELREKNASERDGGIGDGAY